MVCNLVTYRARSAVREVGYALGFPRPLVDRVAKALETYDSVMVRRDLEAEGGFAEFFAAPADEAPDGAGSASQRRLLDDMGELRRLAPVSDLRAGPTDDEGGPGDTPVSALLLRHEAERQASMAALGAHEGMGGHEAADVEPAERRIIANSLGAIELDPLPPRRRGSTVGLSPWDRWLELCARIDGFPRHLSIHAGGMLVTAAPARRHRAARAGHDARPCRRPVRQARRRDDQAHQARPARPAHALRDRRRAARHPGRLRGLRRPRPPARGHPRGLRDDPGGRHRGRLPDRIARPDADAAAQPPGDARRPRRRGGDHPARARSRATRSIPTCAAGRAWSR